MRRCSFPVRYQILLLIFLLAYEQYLVGSVVHMRKLGCPKQHQQPSGKKLARSSFNETFEENDDEFSLGEIRNRDDSKKDKRYICEWTRNDWDQILNAPFYGQLVAYLPGGFISDYYGVRWILFITTIIFGVANSMAVLLAPLHWTAFFGCRVVYGLAAGFMRPAIWRYVVNWATPLERCKFCSVVMAGHCVAFCMNFFIWNTLVMDWTWKFHLVSIQAGVVAVPFWFFGSERPDRCKRIGENELLLIEDAQDGSISEKKVIPPYKHMLTSSAVWAISIVHFGNTWGIYCLMKLMPEYISTIAREEAAETTGKLIIGILPYVCRGVAGIGFGVLGDMCVKRKWLSKTMAIQVMAVFSHILPGLALMSVGTIKKLATCTIVLMTVGALNGAIVVSTLKCTLDQAPNFTATIFSINSMLAEIATVCAQKLRVFLQIHVDMTVIRWTLNFVVGGGMMLSTGLIFIFFASGEMHWWNNKRLLKFRTNREDNILSSLSTVLSKTATPFGVSENQSKHSGK